MQCDHKSLMGRDQLNFVADVLRYFLEEKGAQAMESAADFKSFKAHGAIVGCVDVQ
jgi:hypothetical protein